MNPFDRPPPEPAASLSKPKRSKAKRKWDKDHPARGFRIDPATLADIQDIQRYYEQAGYRCSQDNIVQNLLDHAIEAWHDGLVDIDAYPLQPTPVPMPKDNHRG